MESGSRPPAGMGWRTSRGHGGGWGSWRRPTRRQQASRKVKVGRLPGRPPCPAPRDGAAAL